MKIYRVLGLFLGLLVGGCAQVTSTLSALSNDTSLSYLFPDTLCNDYTGQCFAEGRPVNLRRMPASTWGPNAGANACRIWADTGILDSCMPIEGSYYVTPSGDPTHVGEYYCKPFDPHTVCTGYSNQPHQYKRR